MTTKSPIDQPEANDDFGDLVLELLVCKEPWAAELFELAVTAYAGASPEEREAAAHAFAERAAALPDDPETETAP